MIVKICIPCIEHYAKVEKIVSTIDVLEERTNSCSTSMISTHKTICGRKSLKDYRVKIIVRYPIHSGSVFDIPIQRSRGKLYFDEEYLLKFKVSQGWSFIFFLQFKVKASRDLQDEEVSLSLLYNRKNSSMSNFTV